MDAALDLVRDLSQRGFNLVRFCDLLEEEIRSLLLYRSLKDPEKVLRVEDFVDVAGVISQIKLFNAGSGWRTLTCVLVYVYAYALSLIHISEPTRRSYISYAVFCLKKA